MSISDAIKRIIPLLLACILFGSVLSGGLACAAPATHCPGSYQGISMDRDCGGLCPDETGGAGTATSTTINNFS